MVLPTGPAEWLVDLTLDATIGWLRDDQLRALDPASVLALRQQATLRDNAARAQHGLPARTLTGWLIPPSYDQAAHRLTWAPRIRIPAAPEAAQPDATLSTRTLDRDGYVGLDLTTTEVLLPATVPIAQRLLAGLELRPARRYAAFLPGRDHEAEGYAAGDLLGVKLPWPEAATPDDRAHRLAWPAAGLALAVLALLAVIARRIRRRRGTAAT